MTATLQSMLVALASPEASATFEEAAEHPGRVAEVGEDIYFHYLELLVPRLMLGSVFCFAEGDEPYKLFWRRAGRHYVRQLTWEETRALAQLASAPSGE